MPKTALIVTGESSGELYGSLLAVELKRLWPGLRVLGVGGERMVQAGVEVFSGIAGAFGLTEALSAYKAVKETFRKTVSKMESERPDLVVLIDYPDFNFRVGRKARELGIKVLYYVSPQVWAWRSGRVRTMAEFVDRLAVVLPFEEEFYRGSGMPCEFVGHPILDEMETLEADKGRARELLGLPAGRPCIALLPGSRRSELTRHLPLLEEVAPRLRQRYPDYSLFMPVAPNVDENEYAPSFERLRGAGVTVRRENAVLAFAASEAAVVASGTATLQAAFRETPMVVIYRVFPLTYWLGRLIIRVKYATIANLILGREAVPELLQGRANPDTVMEELGKLLSDTQRRGRMVQDLRAVKAPFEGKRPSRRVAEMAGELAGWQA